MSRKKRNSVPSLLRKLTWLFVLLQTFLCFSVLSVSNRSQQTVALTESCSDGGYSTQREFFSPLPFPEALATCTLTGGLIWTKVFRSSRSEESKRSSSILRSSGGSYSSLKNRTSISRVVMKRECAIAIHVVTVLWSLRKDNGSYTHSWRTDDAVVQCPYTPL